MARGACQNSSVTLFLNFSLHQSRVFPAPVVPVPPGRGVEAPDRVLRGGLVIREQRKLCPLRVHASGLSPWSDRPGTLPVTRYGTPSAGPDDTRHTAHDTPGSPVGPGNRDGAGRSEDEGKVRRGEGWKGNHGSDQGPHVYPYKVPYGSQTPSKDTKPCLTVQNAEPQGLLSQKQGEVKGVGGPTDSFGPGTNTDRGPTRGVHGDLSGWGPGRGWGSLDSDGTRSVVSDLVLRLRTR